MAMKIDIIESAKAVGSNSDFPMINETNIPIIPPAVAMDPMIFCTSIGYTR